MNKKNYEILNGHSPSISHLCVFGCLCFGKDHVNNDKMTPKGITCMFVGYAVKQKEYKVYNLKTQFVFVSRDVVFYENQFPFKGYAAIEQPLFVDNVRPYLDDKVDVPSNEQNQSGINTIDSINTQLNDQNNEATNV